MSVPGSWMRRTATFGYAQELVFSAFGCLQVDLCRQVALGVHLVVHVERCVLRITQVALRIGIEDTLAQRLFVAETGPYFLTLLAVDNGGTGILAQRQLTFASHFRITQEGQRHILVIGTCLGVTQYLCYLLVMRATQHKTYVMESLLCHQRQRLRSHLQNLVSFKLADRNMVLGQQIILCFILSQLKHRCILKFSHNILF